MTSPHHVGSRRRLLLVGGALALVLLASLLDPWAYSFITYPGVYAQNWGRLARIIGWLPFWLLVGAAFYRIGKSALARRRAMLVMFAPALSGAFSEVLKLLIRRERPTAAAGAYVFRSFAEHPFSTGRFGMPSGDATVAFAAALILTRTWPEAWPIWYALAMASALGRVLSRAHYLSDVTVAAILGTLVAEWLWRRYGTVPEEASPIIAA